MQIERFPTVPQSVDADLGVADQPAEAFRILADAQRHLLGRVYATLVSELLAVPVYDSQCGLKLVPRAAFERVADRLEVRGFAFDVELMVALLDTGCAIQEVPIDWHEVPGGKVSLLRDSWRMARDVWRIRARRAVWGSASG